MMMGKINTGIAGRRFGDLTTLYSDLSGKRIACRCRCSRMIFANVDDLASGVITSCGCSPPSLIHRIKLREMATALRRAISFSIEARALARR